MDDQVNFCPECLSLNVDGEAPDAEGWRRFTCRDCGHKWDERPIPNDEPPST